MEHIERFNPYGSANIEPIVDETNQILSPSYLYTIFDELFNSYQIISDYCGIMLPYVFYKEFLIIGTSKRIYFIDRHGKKVVKQFEIPSLCINIFVENTLVIVICETDIVIISKSKKTEYNFSDVISEYNLQKGNLTLSLMDGTHKYIKCIFDE